MASGVRISYSYVDAQGKDQTIRINAACKQEADKKFQEFLDSGEGQERSKAPLLHDFVDEVFHPSFMEGLHPTTVNNYEQYLHYNIIPYLGDMLMDDVTVATVQQFQLWMAQGKRHGRKNNLNAKKIDRVCGFAGRIFKVAEQMGIIRQSPFKSVLLKNPGQKAGHHVALPDEEVTRIKREIPEMSNPEERMYMGLLVYTGMRREEILGLRWQDVFLDEGYALVSQAVTYPERSKPHVGIPKTESSARTVLIVEDLRKILAREAGKTGYIFGGEQPLCYSTAMRLRKRAFDHLGIRGFNNHDFRTTLGTQLKEQGVSSAVIADILGHADTRMVETVYARTRHDGIMKQMQALEALNRC